MVINCLGLEELTSKSFALLLSSCSDCHSELIRKVSGMFTHGKVIKGPHRRVLKDGVSPGR